MPNKLKVLIGLIGIGMLGSLASGLQGSTSGWLSFLLDAALLAGVLKGKEGARNFLMLLAVLGLLGGVFGVVLTLIAVLAGGVHGGSELLLVFAIGGVSVLVLAQNAFALWCLSRRDVQNWMFQKSLGAMGADAPGGGSSP
ncbi:MAG TPA: hypothetical protein VMI75_20520 [Polyangiaceae bacterium]|nr:hypothetical protein [Polyangiaceae bacterium]